MMNDHEELQRRVKEAVQAVLAQLEGFTEWEKFHILDCAKMELSEMLDVKAHDMNIEAFFETGIIYAKATEPLIGEKLSVSERSPECLTAQLAPEK